jgi:hypothetical protein
MNRSVSVFARVFCFFVISQGACAEQIVQPLVSRAHWFRGQLHTHSYWSDGQAFPEQAIEAYKQRGYDFMCLSDHNQFAKSTSTWREVKPTKVTQAIFNAYVKDFGSEWVETKTEKGTNGTITSVRLKKRYRDRILPGNQWKLDPGCTHTVNFTLEDLRKRKPCLQPIHTHDRRVNPHLHLSEHDTIQTDRCDLERDIGKSPTIQFMPHQIGQHRDPCQPNEHPGNHHHRQAKAKHTPKGAPFFTDLFRVWFHRHTDREITV